MDIREYVKDWRVETLANRGLVTRDDDDWQHYSYTVRIHNATGQHFDSPWMQGTGITTNPAEQVAEIVDSLISDVWSYQQASNFEDWAGEYGYDTDPRKAKKIYQQIAAMAAGVVAMFGGQDEFERVATEVDRL